MRNRLVLVTLDGIRKADLLECVQFRKIIEKGLFLSNLTIANGILYSYPGYDELLTGGANGLIDGNKSVPNPNISFVEKLLKDKKLDRDEILLVTYWNHFNYIYNSWRSKIKPVNWTLGGKPEPILTNTITTNLPNYHYHPLDLPDDSVMHDLKVYKIFKKCLLGNRAHRYRYLHLALGLTDSYAHLDDYQQYRNYINLAGDCLLELLELFGISNNRNTYLLITTDHGRGEGDNWNHHSSTIKGSNKSWGILLGPKIASSKYSGEVSYTVLTNIMENILS